MLQYSKETISATFKSIRGKEQKKKGLFADIAQIEVDHPPSYPISDKLFFDKFHFS